MSINKTNYSNMKNSNISLVFIIYFLVSSLSVFAQNKDIVLFKKQDSLSLYNRIERLEGMKENISTNLDNKFTTQSNEINKQNSIIYIVFGVFVVIGGGSCFFGIGYIKTFIKNKIEDKISGIVEEQKDKIIQIIKDVDTENIIKENSKILVLSPNQETDEKTKILFTKKFNDIKEVNFMALQNENDIDNLSTEITDLIIINDINNDNKFAENIIDGLIKKYQDYKTCFLYYGVQNPRLFSKKNINFANSEFTLYSRIIETLKMQAILKK